VDAMTSARLAACFAGVSLCENFPAQNDPGPTLTQLGQSREALSACACVAWALAVVSDYAAIDSGAGVAGSGPVSACAGAAAGLGPIITNATIAPTRATIAPTRRPSLSA
jgi:hypothetical protein